MLFTGLRSSTCRIPRLLGWEFGEGGVEKWLPLNALSRGTASSSLLEKHRDHFTDLDDNHTIPWQTTRRFWLLAY